MIISFTKKISSAALVLCCSSLEFFVLQTFFETMPREAKKMNLCLTLSLSVEVSESRPFSSNFVRLALVVFCPSASLAGLVSSSSFNHSS